MRRQHMFATKNKNKKHTAVFRNEFRINSIKFNGNSLFLISKLSLINQSSK